MAGVTTYYQTGIHSARPANGSGCVLYSCTTHSLVYRDDGTTWTTFLTLPGAGLTDPMTTRGDMIYRDSSNATSRLGRGSANTFLGSDGTDLAWGSVTDAKLSTSDITTNNVSTSKHGFAPKGDANAAHYLDGTGAYSTPSGSGGLAHSTVGYPTIGGSSAAMTQYDHYLKKVTLSAASLLASVSFYTKNTAGGAANSPIAGVWDDNAGAPNHIRAASSLAVAVGSGYWPETVSGVAADAQWLTLPIGVWLAAGDYWIGFMNQNAGNYAVYYDGSGSDRKWTGIGGNLTGASTRYTITTTSNKYSIYADILS